MIADLYRCLNSLTISSPGYTPAPGYAPAPSYTPVISYASGFNLDPPGGSTSDISPTGYLTMVDFII